jgi:hypothetical protein
MQVTLPEGALPATLRLNPEHSMSDDEYYDLHGESERVLRADGGRRNRYCAAGRI